jgi:phosphate:Na+ symporter
MARILALAAIFYSLPAYAADDSIFVGQMAMELVGGLALFLFGIDQMTDSLKSVAGERMRMVLARLTTNRYMGALTGAFVTAIIQSSSVTTVLVVGFTTAGLMSFAQSIGVIMGANIGTTVTAQIVAFKVTKAALLMIAVGFSFLFFSKRDRFRNYGGIIMGLGLVFFGMSVMSEAMQPLRSYQPFLDLMMRMENPFVGILIAAAFTALIQSSSATTAIVIVMAGQGFVSLPAGIALAFGANIGTCVTALLAAIGKPREAFRAAATHVFFNFAGVLLWLGLIDQLATFVTFLSPSHSELTGSHRLAAEAPRQIANAHTIFNVANTLIFIWFTTLIARLMEWLIPDKPLDEARLVTALYLDEELLSTPSLALDMVRREMAHMGAVNDLENIGDVIEMNLVELGHRRIDKGVAVSLPTQVVLSDFHHVVTDSVEAAVNAVAEDDDDAAKSVTHMKKEISSIMNSAALHEAQRLVANEPHRIEAYTIEMDIAEKLQRIYYFARRMARTVRSGSTDEQSTASAEPVT